jgi:SAM-dependent methyltransferase
MEVSEPAAAVAVEAPPDPQTCAACGNAEFHALFETTDRLCRATRERFRIVECGQCGILRVHPRPTPEERRALARPPAWPKGATLADWLERAYRRFVLSDELCFVERAFRHSAVDDGALLDLSPDGEPLRRALEGRGIRVLAGTPGAPPPAAGSCAAITMFDTLGRLEDPAAVLETARKALAEQGRLVIALPNASSWQFLMFGENWSGLDVPRRLIHFRASDIELLLDCCGFEVLRRKHFTLGRNPADFAASFAPGLDPALRRARHSEESPAGRLARNVLYLMLTVVALPFTAIESACRAGSTILIEARRKW